MFVQIDNGPEPPGRHHPWTVGTKNSAFRYLDFKARPELIRTSLEDFKPWEKFPAVERFYELLEWLNGPDCKLETNDCGLRPPRFDKEPPFFITFENPLVVHGRLAILFRNLKTNSEYQSVLWLRDTLLDCLRRQHKFPAALFAGLWPHFFDATGLEGNVVEAKFWAWGEDEHTAMQNLEGIAIMLRGCLGELSSFCKGPAK
jgi:hypothetical protein